MLDKKTTELTTTERQLSRRAFGRSLVALAVTGSMMLTGCSKPQSSSDAKPASGTSTTAATGSAPALAMAIPSKWVSCIHSQVPWQSLKHRSKTPR